MLKLIAWRLVQLPCILLAVYTTTFMLAWIIPGNPFEKDGRRPPQEVIEAMSERYNLNNPTQFYSEYLWKASGLDWAFSTQQTLPNDAPIFNFGPSLRHENWTVNEIIASQLPVSMVLGMCAICIALCIGIFSGVISAVRPKTLLTSLTVGISLIGISVPSFVVGVILLVVFSVWLNWFPVGGWGSWGHIVLPAFTLSLPFAAYIAQFVRTGMIEQLASDHITTARAKGLPERVVIMKHALKNACLPVLSYLGPATAAAMTGSFVVEKVFAVPGIGTHFVDAVLGKDITVLMGIVLVYASMLTLFNLFVDVLYIYIDPRTH